MILVDYYAPNGEKEQVEVLTQIKEFLSKIEYNQNTAIIWGGDLNVIFYKSLDADSGNQILKIQSLTIIHKLMAENEFWDIFRLRHPGEPRFIQDISALIYNSLLNDKDFISQMKIKIPEFYEEATELSNPNAR